MKSENKMTSFFVIVFLHYAAANFAHPITPTLIVELQLPSYTFGTAFATMALTSFLFSPFWAKMKELFSARLLLLTGSVGYGLGQFFSDWQRQRLALSLLVLFLDFLWERLAYLF